MISNNKTKWVLGICEYLIIIFIVLKLTGAIDWTWWQVFSPSIIAFFAGFAEGFIVVIAQHFAKRKEND